MLAVPHMMAGAAIGKVLRRPQLAWPVAFASHFLLDFAPHLDSHALFGVKHGGPTGPETAMAIADMVLGVVLVGMIAARHPQRRVILGGALFGILIDLVDNVPPWGIWFRTWPATAWLSQFHHSFQHNVTPAQWPLGVATQVAVMAIALWVIYVPRRSALDAAVGDLHEARQ